MSKNFFHRLKESLSYSNKSKDFERAKEVLFSSKTPKQLASAVNYINNFNKKHGITKDSPEFIYFDKMILAMKLKIKNRKGGISEEMDDSSRLNRIIKNIIKESLEWSDKDNSYGNDEKYSADASWKTDDNWTPNPDKSYWKQGSTGTGSGGSSDGGDVNEEEDILDDEDELDWIRQVGEFPNYNGFPQGVVYVDNHQEIDLFYELLQKINPKDFVGRGDINELHQGLESMRDEVEAEGYDSSEAILSISFFVEKDYPGGLSFGYWSYDVDEGGIYDWLKYDDTFNREYKLYNCVYDLEKDVKNLIN